MSTRASLSIPEEPGTSARGQGRFAAIGEVVLAFVFVHVTYRAIKHFTVLGQWDDRTNFIPGLVMAGFTVAALSLCRRSFAAYGLGTKRWRYHLALGLVCSLVLFVAEALAFVVTKVGIDVGSPPDPHAPFPWVRMAGLAAVAVPVFVAILFVVRKQRKFIERISPALSVPAIVLLWTMLPLAGAHFQHRAMWLQALWLFLGAGFGEEIFFRGYIQSRVDQAFGCPFRLLGFDVGPGLLVSSLLFGFIHALNTVDYFNGRFDFGWAYGAQNIFTGLFFGLLRARTGSVLPGAIVHGLQDTFARIPGLLP